MEANAQLLYDTKRLMLVRYPRFASEIAAAKFEYRTDLKYHTAATDGKDVFFDPDYLASLSEDDRLFIIAHELMHIKFGHAFRFKLLDKDGNKRNIDVFNEAADAIINANLERDGFKIKKGYVNRPDALKYNVEEFYKILLQERENEKQNNLNGSQNNSDSSNSSDNQDSNSNEQEHQGDDHSLWEEAFEKHQQEIENKEPMKNQDGEIKKKSDNSVFEDVDERAEFSNNRQQRQEIAKENLRRMREQALKNISNNTTSEEIKLGNVGESKNSIDWKLLVRREIEKSETIWSQRRSISENNYAYRLEENDIEEDAETEVMIDVSGSVDLDLVKSFLRVLKPLLKHSKLRVGCFNEKYWGMVEIKSVNDIDNFVIPEGARGYSARTEDWDLAVRSFTKKREINKFVFTDGEPCPGTMPKEDLKNENVIWLVYGNKNFRPCCGKVINITSEQLEELNTNKIQSTKSR